MPYWNKAELMGNICGDLEPKFLNGGERAALNFSLAINRKFKKGDQVIEVTDYVDVSAFGKPAELIAKHCGKGDCIFVMGRLQLDRWQDIKGEKNQKLKVVLEDFQFIKTKKEGK